MVELVATGIEFVPKVNGDGAAVAVDNVGASVVGLPIPDFAALFIPNPGTEVDVPVIFAAVEDIKLVA